jgi:hypothetical protein
MNMYPLDFEEFMMATGQSKAISVISGCYENNEPCALHPTFLDSYNRYLYIGGMPQVVKEWIESGDHNLVAAIQRNINDAYIADMAKYATPSETVRIMAVFNSIPAQLAKDNRKFQYSTIKSGARAGHYESAIDWLDAAGIVMKCIKVTSGAFPLKIWAEPSSFKTYLNDTGLLCTKFGIPPSAFVGEISGYDNIKGALSENYVANHLTFNGLTPFYWESRGKAEVDFVIQNNSGEVIPIEVKSSQHVRSKSLQQYVSGYSPRFSVRISTKNFGFENNIKSVPLYAVYCIKS